MSNDYWINEAETYFTKRANDFHIWREAKKELHGEAIDHPQIELGGKPYDANWVCSDFPIECDEDEVPGQSRRDTFYYPLTEDGRRFRYIGNVAAFDWRCTIHLFFDPQEKRVLPTFDWT